ncbi:MAG: UDP-N-acetylmuramate:L-alanyl-gamma-D-glutamyl-meso-diaminopimelate ligase [Moraxella sp.]|nr:UDP-N-acetylmuramate:L-alanyl-gamma-D-glutamyl-meso-diaminopimelate ligase [Moraxella sp.]
MHIHILGICGTFMGSLALLARELGHTVTGSDQNVYPPMSTQLENAGIQLMQGYDRSHLQNPTPDLVVVGNAMKRGIDAVEYLLDSGLAYTSGPQFLADYILQGKHTLAVAGTHGKTTTSTMLAWVLDFAGLNPSFLIGGVPLGFPQSARLTNSPYFVVEADEYDSAFFDKRSKFVHYRPKTAILNNLEFDHADIFDDLAAIQKQFHHLVRTIPSQGQIIYPVSETSIDEVLAMGCWSPVVRTGLDGDNADLTARLLRDDGSYFEVLQNGKTVGTVNWQMTGKHNVMNALSVIGAALHIGIEMAVACEALSKFAGVKRRMELIGNVGGVEIYDDFAHHPTAIATTLDGARKKVGKRKIWAIIEPRSNTMKLGVYQSQLAPSASLADSVIWYEPVGLDWSVKNAIGNIDGQMVMNDIDEIVGHLADNVGADDVVIVMSNGGFGGIHDKIVQALSI